MKASRFAIVAALAVTAIALLVPTLASAASRAGYCSVPGNYWTHGAWVRNEANQLVLVHAAGPIAPGTFLNLELNQPALDSNLKGATPAIFVQGKGLTCDAPSAGFKQAGTIGLRLGVPKSYYGMWVRA